MGSEQGLTGGQLFNHSINDRARTGDNQRRPGTPGEKRGLGYTARRVLMLALRNVASHFLGETFRRVRSLYPTKVTLQARR